MGESSGVLEAESDGARDLEGWQQAQLRLNAAGDLLKVLGKLEEGVRRHHIQTRYQDPLNAAMRRVLTGYAHRDRVRSHTRVYCDAGNALRLAVGNHGDQKLDRGLMSLSPRGPPFGWWGAAGGAGAAYEGGERRRQWWVLPKQGFLALSPS